MKKIVLMMVAALTALSFSMVAIAAEPKKEETKPAAEKKADDKTKKDDKKKDAKPKKQLSGC
jgi:ABC-type transporter MlaC component